MGALTKAETLHVVEFFSVCSDVLLVVSPDGTIVLANPACNRLLKRKEDTLRGLEFLELLHPDDRAGVEDELAIIPSPSAFRCRCQSGDGSYRSLTWKRTTDPETGAHYLMGSDADTVRMEKKLQDTEEKLRALFDNTAQSIISVARDGNIRSVNPMTETMFGYEENELVGQSVETLLPKSLGEAHRAHRQTYFASPRNRPMGQGLELMARRKDGVEFPVEISLSHIHTDAGPSAVAFVNDITERRRAAIDKAKLEHRLEHATKMEAVGRLAGGIAHDFNNLLTALSGFSEIVLDELPEDHTLYRGAQESYKTCQRSASLVRRLLTVSRRQMQQPQILDLNGRITELEKMLRGLLGEDIELRVKLEPGRAHIHADESQIEQVLLNLIVNARDAMPKGGALTIQTSSIDIDDAFVEHHVGVRTGPHVLLTISDTGEGMSADTLEHVFEPFFTTKERGKGTGLGLATVYGIVQQSHGSIWAYSEPGQGTTFKIYLPQIEPGRASTPRDSATSKRDTGSETILVVEDENTVRLVTVSHLTNMGYDVLEARDGEEALRVASEHDGRISLLLTDVVMPRMNGPEISTRLTERFPSLRVMFMSGHADDALAHHGIITQGLAFLEKPFTREDLGRKVREVLDQAPSATAS